MVLAKMTDNLEKILKQGKLVEFQIHSRIIHQVKVMDKDGKVIKVIPAEELKDRHWEQFRRMEHKMRNMSIKQKTQEEKKNEST